MIEEIHPFIESIGIFVIPLVIIIGFVLGAVFTVIMDVINSRNED